MADWQDRDALVNYIRWQWLQAGVSIGRADVHWSDAWVQMYQGGSYDVAQQDMLDCLSDILNAVKQLLSPKSGEYPLNAVPYYLWHYTSVSWQAICEAWTADDFEGRFWTIAVIDRMRQIIWDEPFFISWAARPEIKL